MYRLVFGEFVFIAMAGLCFANEQINHFTADNGLNDLTCSGSDMLFWKQPASRAVCAALCENGNQCAGFTFRASDEKCVGCKDGPAAVVTQDLGMVFYEPTLGKCDSQCTECMGDKCMYGMCVLPGYSFNFTTWTCVTSCDIYGDTFQKYPDKAILHYNLQCGNHPTVEGCFQLCRDTTSCRSLEYAQSIGDCCVNAVTPLDVPEAYGAYNSDFYNRNCKK